MKAFGCTRVVSKARCPGRTPGRQALLVLVHLCRNETFAGPAAFGVGAATVHHYVTEVIELLAGLAPDLRRAMRIAQRKAYVILDGTPMSTISSMLY